MQIHKDAIASIVECFPQTAQLETSIKEEFYPPSVKCRVRYTLPATERSVPMTLKLFALSEREERLSFTFDIMAGSSGMNTCLMHLLTVFE